MLTMTTYRKQPTPGGGATPIRDMSSGSTEERDLCEQLKTTYTLERRLYEAKLGKADKQPYSPHPRYEGKVVGGVSVEDTKRKIKNTWLSIVQTLRPSRVHPCLYVRVIFRGIAGTVMAPPYPDQLISKKWMKFFHEQSKNIVEELPEEFRRQCKFSRSYLLRYQQALGYDFQSAVYYLLTDKLAPLSFLYRYCMAISMLREPDASKIQNASLFTRVANRIEREAVIQYTCFPGEYGEVWEDFLPANFSEDAERIYDGMLSVCMDEGGDQCQYNGPG